jgi:hypothetical protein
MTKAGLGPSLLAVFFCCAPIHVHAGIEDQDTGEQCWGPDCFNTGQDIPPSSGDSGGGYVTLSNVEIFDCTDEETEAIDQSVRWLKANMAAIDGQMGRNSLMDWPGNSRANFVDKLNSELHFYCINDKNKCENKPDLLGKVYPVFAQKRVNICGDNIRYWAGWTGPVLESLGYATLDEQTLYTSVVAHEIGHLIRVNTHRANCERSYTQARFSKALGLAVEAAGRGIDYDTKEWLHIYCGIEPTTGASGHASGFEVIDNKLQAPPLQ